MNKRENTRHDCCVPLMDERKESLRNSQTTNISKTGVGFVSARFIPMNTKMMIEIALSREGQPVLVQGKVKWVEQIPNSTNFRVGMNFQDISSSAQSRIDNYFSK